MTMKNANVEKLTNIDTNVRNSPAPNMINWKKFIAIKYEYLVTLVVVKNVQNLQNI